MNASRNRKARLGTLAQIILSLGLLAFVISRAGVGSVWEALTSLDLALYALAGGLFFAGVVLRSLRWQIVLRDFDVQASLGQLVSMYTIGIFFDNLLPTGIGGDVVRALALRRESERGAAAVSSVVANRLVGMFTMSSLGFMALLANPGIFPPVATWAVGGLVVLIVVGVWVVRRDLLTWLSERLPFTRFLTDHPKARALHATTTDYSARTLLAAFAVSVLFTATLVLTQFVIARAMGLDLAVRYFAVAAPIIGAVSMLPISFNGLGVREGVYQLLFGSLGVAASVAVAMSLAFYALRLAVGLVGGGLLVATSARRLSAPEGSRVEG